ncbi:MAG TPA: hypothetical protein PLC42_05800 [Parachlamydiaceae bacterium]|nr:hypothetical protein [Parachlamydiaceae bacterium]
MESPKKYIAIPFDAKSTESKVYEVPSSDSNTQEQRTEKNSSGSYNSEKAFEECIIYFVRLKHENNQGYVGQTNRSLNDRRAEHERNANMGHPG